MAALGSVCLFVSAIAQNYVRPKWADEKAEIEKYELLVSMQESKAHQWWIEFNRRQGFEAPDDQRLEAASMYVAQVAVLLTFGTIRALGPDADGEGLLKTEWALVRTARTLRARGDLQRLTELIGAEHDAIAKNAEKLIKDARLRYRAVAEKETFWNTVFLWLYLAGSSLVAASYMRKWFAALPEGKDVGD